jgi:hypothetical protein
MRDLEEILIQECPVETPARKKGSAIDYYGGKGLLEIIKLDTLII